MNDLVKLPHCFRETTNKSLLRKKRLLEIRFCVLENSSQVFDHLLFDHSHYIEVGWSWQTALVIYHEVCLCMGSPQLTAHKGDRLIDLGFLAIQNQVNAY